MFARLVTGRYRTGLDEQPYAAVAVRTGWLRRMIAALWSRKH